MTSRTRFTNDRWIYATAPRRRKEGFSLAELMVVVVIFGILSSAILLSLVAAQRGWMVGSKEAVLTSEMRRALDEMSRELVESRPAQLQRPPANGVWANALVFRVPQDLNGDGSVLDADGNIAEWSNAITYEFVPGGRENLATRTQVNDAGLAPPTLVSTLANHITDLRFRRQAAAADVVEIRITASTISEGGQVMSRAMGTRVKLRN